VSEDGDRIYTPHKAVRRYADHLIDHLAEVEAQLAGVPTRPDGWHASLVTVDVDWARFTEADLVEATERLTRPSTALRLLAAGPTGWDRPRGDTWTLREIADHVGDAWYAEQVGDLMSADRALVRRVCRMVTTAGLSTVTVTQRTAYRALSDASCAE